MGDMSSHMLVRGFMDRLVGLHRVHRGGDGLNSSVALISWRDVGGFGFMIMVMHSVRCSVAIMRMM